MDSRDFNYNKILVIGVGQIGLAITKRILEYNPKEILLHVYNKEESNELKRKIQKYKDKRTNVTFSYGDIFLPWQLKDIDFSNIKKSEIDMLINYFHTEIDEGIIEKSSLFTLIQNFQPDLVIDAVNSSTVLGHEFEMELAENENLSSEDTLKHYLLKDFNPKLINYVLSLKLGIERYNIKKYLKLSTTALGGMGLDMNFTHGDTTTFCLSNAIIGKIVATGSFHQLLLSLSHTKGCDINIIVPSTCVGWESVLVDTVQNELGTIKLSSSVQTKHLKEGTSFIPNIKIKNNSKEFKIPVVYSGENNSYSLAELTALTSYGQMEAITKEEVADEAMNCILGKSSKELLHAMDMASLKSTFKGNSIRNIVIKKLEDLEKEFDLKSVATGNLGPKVAKHLFELYLIKIALNSDYKRIFKVKSKDLRSIIIKELNTNKDLMNQIISLGLPILLNETEVLVGEKFFVPNSKKTNIINPTNINKWAKEGWVDLRLKNLRKWKKILEYIYRHAEMIKKSEEISLDYDYSLIDNNFNIGNILGYYYILLKNRIKF